MSASVAIGMIGYKFMGKAHSNAYRQINQFFDLPLKTRLKTICGRERPKVEKMAERWGWEEAVTDWRAVIDDPEIRIVDICSPNNTHHDIAIAAFEAGKIVACEKPLAMNGAEAQRMTAAAHKSGQINTVWFNYRRVPAIALRAPADRRGPYRQSVSLPRSLPAGLDHGSKRSAAVAHG